MKGRLWKKALSAVTSVLMLAGAVPLESLGEMASVTAHAAEGSYLQIGDETTSGMSIQGYPVSAWRRYGWSEQIYTAEELCGITSIDALGFHVVNGKSQTFTASFYLLDTDLDTFDSCMIGVPVSREQNVYNGQPSFNESGWVTLDLKETYTHDPTKNLMVIALYIVDGAITTSNLGFSTFYIDTNQTLNYMTDDPNDALPGEYTSGRNVHEMSVIRFYTEDDLCVNVNYHANYPDGTDSVITKQAPINAPYDLESGLFSCPGHTMHGWNTHPYGFGTAYSLAKSFETGISHEIDLWAQWEELPENQVQIGLPMLTDFVGPVFTGNAYGYTEQIYTAAEVGDVRNISGLSFDVSVPLDMDISAELYLMDTELDAFTGNEYISGATKVFDGTLNFSEKGWNEIDFRRGFVHDPSKNLMVVFVNKTGYSCRDILQFNYYTSTDGCIAYCFQSQAASPAADAPQGTSNGKNNIRLTCDAVQIGTVTGVANYTIPISANYRYGWTEQIYTADEVGDNSVFNALGFCVDTPLNADLSFALYLADTDKTAFDSREDFIPLSQAVKVYEGTVNFAETGWYKIGFDEPFIHDPAKSLAVIMVSVDSYGGTVCFAAYHTNNGITARYELTNVSYKEPSSNGSTMGTKNCIRLYTAKTGAATITYKANGGTGSDYVQWHLSGGAATLAGEDLFTRTGYTFTGWNSKADGSGNTYAAGKEVAWINNVTLYAQWQKDTSTITYKANGGTGADVIQEHARGGKVTLYTCSFKRTGYTFTGWNTKADGSGNTYQPGKEVSWVDNVTLYAQWKQITRSITYKANGGTGSDVVQSHGAGSAVTLKPANTFTRKGYTFTGWNSKADGSGNTYAAGKSVSWYDNVTLYAQWKQNTSTITYKANGGTGSDVVQSHGAGSAVTLKPANTFTRKGYTFTGWNSKADGSGNTYAAGKSVSWYDNVTLYAQWKQNTSTITYKANGGTGSDVVQSHGAGSAATLKPANTFTRKGYTFTGWNTKADGSGNTYAAGKSVSWYDNVTLYAQWKQNTSTITYKANGGTGSDAVQSHGAGSKVTLKANSFTRSGYVFIGWNSKADGSGNTYQPGQEVAWYDNVTLYAIWKPARTITYKANGASGADVVQTRGAGVATALKPANTFTRSGYTFQGWNSKADGSGNTYAAGATVSWIDNVTLYAIWKKN